MGQREAGELVRQPLSADLTEVGAVSGGRAADTEHRAPESNGERDRREDSLPTLNQRSPLKGPLHARPPAS
jgi:hypothetical protein